MGQKAALFLTIHFLKVDGLESKSHLTTIKKVINQKIKKTPMARFKTYLKEVQNLVVMQTQQFEMMVFQICIAEAVQQ